MRSKSVADLAQTVDKYLRRVGLTSPGVPRLTRFFEVTYFASLKTEEGKPLQLRIALVDPNDPDPEKPRRLRVDRWKIIPMPRRLPYTVPNLVKLAKAADPWSSSLAVYYDDRGEFFIWALIDQTVHFNTRLVREAESGGYPPAGKFQVLTTGTADLTVYQEFSFVARLAQDSLLKRQIDVFWSGPVHDRLSVGIENNLTSVLKRFREQSPSELKYMWEAGLADKWIGTLCRILISIQRYRHGGALLISRETSDLDIEYRINYSRLARSLINLGVERIKESATHDQIFEGYIERDSDNMPVILYLDQSVAEGEAEDCEDEITGCVRFISSLSCVDGLVLATPNLVVKGFGVEIRTKKKAKNVYIATTANATGRALRPVDPNHYGTRHRSMMRYCMAHPKSLGFVISQDGDIRALTRVGNRVVMWENLKVLSLWEPDFKKKAPAKHQSRN